MKLELIKENSFGKTPWYEIHIDGKYYIGSGIEDLITKQYLAIKEHPTIIEKTREILMSDEIVLPLLEENKEQNNE